VVVASGGARGATAVAVTALAQAGTPRIWLLGTTPLDEVPPEFLDAPGSKIKDLRRAFLRQEHTARPGVPVRELNQRFDALLRAREIQLTMRSLRARCGTDRVHYLTCDVRNRDDVMDAARLIYAEDGRVDVLIHGAGQLHSAPVGDKSLDDFRAVRDTKVIGYHLLKEAFADPPPRLWCTFGSASGVTGYPGDTDYSSANEYLLAAARAELHQGRDEVSLGWGLWRDTGMVKDLATGIGSKEGVTGMSNVDGAATFLAHLAVPRPREPAPILGQLPRWADIQPAPASVGRLLEAPRERTAANARWSWRPDPERDTYLAEHLVDGRPLLPLAIMVALAAEAAQQLVPGQEVIGFRDVVVGEPLFTHPRNAVVAGTISAAVTEPNRVRFELGSNLSTQSGRVLVGNRQHCHLDVLLGARPVPPIEAPPAPLPALEECPSARPDSSVQLSGVWRTNLLPGASSCGAEALWLPSLEPDDIFARLAAPALLIDATSRLFRYPASPEGDHVMGVPTSIARIDLFTGATDTELAAAHPEGLRLWFSTAADRAVAATCDGTVQVAVAGLELHVTDKFARTVEYPQWRP
jgi:NAD(P)-dependent dehydrogenase (short-subunit alcohol dehydrogenase family)